MAEYSYQQLRKFSQTKQKYLNHEYQNKVYAEMAKKEKQAVIDKSKKAVADLDLKIDDVFFKGKGVAIHIVSLVIAVLLFIGGFTFLKPGLSYDFDDVVAAYDAKVESDPDIIPDGLRLSYDIAFGLTDRYYSDSRIEEETATYLEWRTNECELLTGGCMLLAAVVILILFGIQNSLSIGRSNDFAPSKIITAFLLAFYVLCWLVFVCRGAWGEVDGIFSFIGQVLNLLLMLVVSPFGAFAFIGRAGYVMALPALFAPLALTAGYVVYACAHSAFVKKNSGKTPSSKVAAELIEKQRSIARICPHKAEEIYGQIMAKISPNPYKNAYFDIPSDIRDELDAVIGVIEKGYARTSVDAKQFLQRQKNHRELMEMQERHHREEASQRADIKRAIDANTAAIIEASQKSVDVYIHY